MKHIIPLVIAVILFAFTPLKRAQAQDTGHEILFTFDSSQDLINKLESDSDKSVTFHISGLDTEADADALMANFLSTAKVITGFNISEKNADGTREGTLFLYRTVKTSYFTKILITCGIRNIIVDKERILTVDLNDKSKYFVK
jgi:hypothetical protein